MYVIVHIMSQNNLIFRTISVQAFVKKHQVDFLKHVRVRPDFETSPLKYEMDLAVQCYSTIGNYLTELD